MRSIVDPQRLRGNLHLRVLACRIRPPTRNDISLRFSKLWTASLTPEERLHFYAMAKRVAAIDGDIDDAQRQTLARLKDRLGLFRV
jgi:hypothetical protein